MTPYPYKTRGQSAILVAIMLPFLVGFSLLVVEVAERWLQVSMVEDALQQTVRSTVQLLDYRDLATGDEGLRAIRDCHRVTWSQDTNCRVLLTTARQTLITNLTNVRGLDESPTALANRVHWTVLPHGGTCSYTSTAIRPVTETTPLVCAEIRPRMRGIVGWGTYTPLIAAADTLESTRR